jgi:hypothetical protein
MVEVSEGQVTAAADAFAAAALRPEVVRDDLGTLLIGVSTAQILDPPREVASS